MISRKWLKRVVGAVIVSLLTTTVWLVAERAWVRSSGNRDLAAAFAETDATDPDWRWDALNAKRPRPAAGTNSAELIPLVKSQMHKEWGRRLESPEWAPLVSHPPPNVRLRGDVTDEARADLGRSAAAVELALTLAARSHGFREIHLKPDVLSTLLNDTQATREVASLLRWDVIAAVEAGDRERAAVGLLALLNTSRSIGDEPLLISQLIRIACRGIATRSLEAALAQDGVPADKLTALHTAWAADAEESLLLIGLRGERAAFDVVFKNLADGTVTPETISTGKPSKDSFGAYSWWLYRGRYPAERALYHRWVSRAVRAAELPYHEQAAALDDLPLPPSNGKPNMALLLLPLADKVSAAHRRSAAVMRSAVAAVACERFRLKTGRWPETLAEIPADILPAAPLDPFDGQSLRYKKLPDGVVVYSIGENRTDDGGNLTRGEEKGTDEGFRLWNPDRRRLPPPPKPAAADDDVP